MTSLRGIINRSSGVDRGLLHLVGAPNDELPARLPIRLRGHQLSILTLGLRLYRIYYQAIAPCAPHEHPVLCSREGGVGPQGIPHHPPCASCIPKMCMMHRPGSEIPQMDPPGPRTLHIFLPSPQTYKKLDFLPPNPQIDSETPQNLARSPAECRMRLTAAR